MVIRTIQSLVKNIGIRIALTGVLFFFVAVANSQVKVTDQTHFSLITCSPGTEVYSLFGHSAIRLQDEGQGVDMVFNYGLFSFESENFYWNFSRGYTDYLLGVQRFDQFIQAYVYEDRSVLQQNLNLSQSQKQQLLDLLLTNLKPENRVYRYNYFTNNCATKLRDIVLKSTGDELHYYAPEDFETTYRKVVRSYLKPYAWTWLGTDVSLGMPADYTIHFWETMFLPDFLSEGFAKSRLGDGPLIERQHYLHQGANPVLDTPLPLRPVWVFVYVFVLLLMLTFWEQSKGLYFKCVDFTLYLLIGLAGLVISFFSFFSVHPTVYPNLNLLWAVPLHVVFAFTLLKHPNAQWKMVYKKVSGILIIVVCLVHVVGIQYINYSLFPLFAGALLRSGLGIEKRLAKK